MSPNLLFTAFGGALAASWFLAPQFLNSRNHLMRVVVVITLYASVCGGIIWFADAKSAFATLELGLFFTILSKLLVLNLDMVHTANYPKNHRCY
jgi:hypothetical protein